MIELPEILNLPPKLLPFLINIGKYRYYLADGGRGSGKSQAFARIILYVCEKRKVRVCCGRETQNSIEESVYRLLVDLIKRYNLNFLVLSNKIVHKQTGSEIIFKGFRENGVENTKGMEGFDIVWVDEAQTLSKRTIDVVVPTIRKPKSVIWFSMNRFVRADPVYEFCLQRPNCLHVHIDYFENPFCTQELIDEANICKQANEKDYRHIWLGEPMEQASDYLFNSGKVAKMKDIQSFGDLFQNQRVMGIDFAAQGNDLCVATVLDRVSLTQWKVIAQEAWSDADSMSSIGRIVELMGKYKPTAACLDVGGMGYVVYNRLQELGIRINPFNGAEQVGVPNEYGNTRAWGYYTLNEYINNEWIIMNSSETEKELLDIRFKYKSNGERLILSKEDMRKDGIHSPDRADSLMMAVFCIKRFLNDGVVYGKTHNIVRRNVSMF